MNPATRLLNLSEKIAGNQSNAQALSVWNNIFQINSDSEESNYYILRNISSIIELIFIVEEKMNQIKGLNLELFKEPLDSLKSIFLRHNFYNNWNKFSQQFTPELLTGLKFLENEISKIYEEEEIESTKLEEFTKEINKLFSEIHKKSIDLTLKSYLLETLSELLNAIRNYQIFGAEGIKSAVAKGVGNTIIEKEQIKNPTESDEGFLKQVLEALIKCSKLIKIVKNGKALIYQLHSEFYLENNSQNE